MVLLKAALREIKGKELNSFFVFKFFEKKKKKKKT